MTVKNISQEWWNVFGDLVSERSWEDGQRFIEVTSSMSADSLSREFGSAGVA